LVYDGSARFEGVSLNSMLYQGRDDLQRLCEVLVRFRRYPVAFSCDIQEMFMQCAINEPDRAYSEFYGSKIMTQIVKLSLTDSKDSPMG